MKKVYYPGEPTNASSPFGNKKTKPEWEPLMGSTEPLAPGQGTEVPHVHPYVVRLTPSQFQSEPLSIHPLQFSPDGEVVL
jgi:hypothetical protein